MPNALVVGKTTWPKTVEDMGRKKNTRTETTSENMTFKWTSSLAFQYKCLKDSQIHIREAAAQIYHLHLSRCTEPSELLQSLPYQPILLDRNSLQLFPTGKTNQPHNFAVTNGSFKPCMYLNTQYYTAATLTQ